MRNWRQLTVGFLTIIAVLTLAGCPTEAVPTGGLNVGPGQPGGGGLSGGTDGSFPVFDINNLPSSATWNTIGEFYEYPNPFLRADGTMISTPDEWFGPNGRREEVRKLVQHYYMGYYPPQPDTVVGSGPGLTGPGNITVTVTANGREATHTYNNLFIPANTPNGRPVSVQNKVPLIILCGSVGTAVFREQGYATIELVAATDTFDGLVQSLFQYDNTSPNRPASFMRDAWKAARLLDVIETQGIGGGVIDIDKLVVTGMSRWGKDPLMIGAFCESKSGKRISVVVPVSAGSAGVHPDRWTSFKSTTGLTYPDRVENRDAQGYDNYYLRFLDRDVTPLSIKIQQKYYDGGIDDLAGENHGVQVVADIGREFACWVGARVFELSELHKDWHIESRAPYGIIKFDGILGTMPLDTHFVNALVAPNALLAMDGWHSSQGRTHPEGMYMGYMMAREVYDFLEVPTYAGVRLYDIDHAYPAREQLDLVDFANYFFNDRDSLTGENEYKRIVPGATPLPTLAEFNDTLTVPGFDEPQPFATWYNPWMREDYLRFNWKNPNRTKKWTGEIGEAGQSIAANVRQYFSAHPSELVREGTTLWEIDYPASVVEGGYAE